MKVERYHGGNKRSNLVPWKQADCYDGNMLTAVTMEITR
jgi:hypothetical protein